MNAATTITAISTAPGIGGIAVIRVSGTDALKNCDPIFSAKKNTAQLAQQAANTVCFGRIVNGKNEIIDEVLATVFKMPHSFTGEDVVEISCHGSLFVQQQILQLLLENGCVLAQPGEFTQRAFLNGKMDLSQAEAVADLIASTSAASHRMALNQMRGGFSNQIKDLRTQLLNFASLIEMETLHEDEKPIVSEVIWNRQRDGAPLGIGGGLQRLNVGDGPGQRHLRGVAHKVLELVVLGDEVGFGVHLDGDAGIARNGHAHQTLGGGAAALLGSGSQTLGTQRVHGGFKVAIGLVESLLAIHHASASTLAQVLHVGGGIGHVR